MKIGFLINSLTKGGGAERIVQTLSNYYNSIGFDVTIVLVDHADSMYPLNKGVRVYNLGERIENKRKILTRVRRFIKLLKREDFDVFISFLARSNLINIIGHKVVGKKQIIISERSFSVRNYRKDNFKNFVMKRVLKLLYKKADLIIAISNGIKDSLINDFNVNASKITTIYNPIDLKVIQELSLVDDGNVIEKVPYICTMGRLIKSKRHDLTIRAFSKVAQKEDIKLYVIGDGPERGNLIKLVNNLGLEDKIIFTGNLNNPFPIIRNGKIFLLCSEYEAFGNVIIESMSLGLPIITVSDNGGPNEILDNGTYGIVVEDDLLAISDEINSLLEDKRLYSKYSAVSKERSMDFNIIKIADKYLEVSLKTKNKMNSR